MTTATVGIRDLKSHLSAYLRRIKAGESLVITDRGEPIGRIVPMETSLEQKLRSLEDLGVLAWSGRKPESSGESPPRVRGDRSVADLLLEDRE